MEKRRVNMLVKYINETTVIYANYDRILEYDNKQVINPRDEDFLKAKYKELIETEEPSYNLDTEYLQTYYLEENDKIIQKWEVKKIEESEV
jgi:hypothetical protein